MKILRVAAVANNRLGGMSRTMYCTGDCLLEFGHTVNYIFSDAYKWKIPKQLKRFTMPWETVALVRKSLNRDPDINIVEIHEPLAYAYGLRRRYSSKYPPLVIFSYGIETRSLEIMRDYKSKKRIPFSPKSRMTSTLLAKQADLGLKLASHIICSNQQDIEYLKGRGFPDSRLTRHYSGVESAFLGAENTQTQRDAHSLLFVGSWIERKGILDLVPAFNIIAEQVPEASLTLAGTFTPESDILTAFSPLARERVRVIPSVTNQSDLIKIYAEHSVLLLPSYFEGFPLVMVEAAAMGLAIVTSGICGMADFLQDGDSGIFVDVGEPNQLAKAVIDLIRDPQQVRKLGQRACEQAKIHTWHGASLEIERAYFAAQRDNR